MDGNYMFRKYTNRGDDACKSGSHYTEDMVRIAELKPNVACTRIVALVIANQGQRIVPSKKEPGAIRSLVSFTLRDSPTDTINATCWGKENYIKEVAKLLQIGNIVEIKNTIICNRIDDFVENRYKPTTTSNYQLTLSENHSNVHPYKGDLSRFWSLNCIPTKASNDFFPLADIEYHGENMHDQHVNLLIAVKSIENIKEVTTKQGRQVKKLVVRVFDQTSMNFHITIWGDEQTVFAKGWIPGETVLFVADIRVHFDAYKKCMVGSCDSKTIFTPNPNSKDAGDLYQYANELRNNFLDDYIYDGNNKTVEEVFTVASLKSKLFDKKSDQVFYGLVYAFVTCLDIDGIVPIHVIRCKNCQNEICDGIGQCTNKECSTGIGAELPQNEISLQMRVSLSDHTGTIHRCCLGGLVAETLLGLSSENVLKLDDFEKTNMKWRFLFERCTVVFKAMHSTFESEKPVVRIIGCTLANIEELLSK